MDDHGSPRTPSQVRAPVEGEGTVERQGSAACATVDAAGHTSGRTFHTPESAPTFTSPYYTDPRGGANNILSDLQTAHSAAATEDDLARKQLSLNPSVERADYASGKDSTPPNTKKFNIEYQFTSSSEDNTPVAAAAAATATAVSPDGNVGEPHRHRRSSPSSFSSSSTVVTREVALSNPSPESDSLKESGSAHPPLGLNIKYSSPSSNEHSRSTKAPHRRYSTMDDRDISQTVRSVSTVVEYRVDLPEESDSDAQKEGTEPHVDVLDVYGEGNDSADDVMGDGNPFTAAKEVVPIKKFVTKGDSSSSDEDEERKVPAPVSIPAAASHPLAVSDTDSDDSIHLDEERKKRAAATPPPSVQGIASLRMLADSIMNNSDMYILDGSARSYLASAVVQVSGGQGAEERATQEVPSADEGQKNVMNSSEEEKEAAVHDKVVVEEPPDQTEEDTKEQAEEVSEVEDVRSAEEVAALPAEETRPAGESLPVVDVTKMSDSSSESDTTEMDKHEEVTEEQQKTEEEPVEVEAKIETPKSSDESEREEMKSTHEEAVDKKATEEAPVEVVTRIIEGPDSSEESEHDKEHITQEVEKMEEKTTEQAFPTKLAESAEASERDTEMSTREARLEERPADEPAKPQTAESAEESHSDEEKGAEEHAEERAVDDEKEPVAKEPSEVAEIAEDDDEEQTAVEAEEDEEHTAIEGPEETEDEDMMFHTAATITEVLHVPPVTENEDERARNHPSTNAYSRADPSVRSFATAQSVPEDDESSAFYSFPGSGPAGGTMAPQDSEWLTYDALVTSVTTEEEAARARVRSAEREEWLCVQQTLQTLSKMLVLEEQISRSGQSSVQPSTNASFVPRDMYECDSRSSNNFSSAAGAYLPADKDNSKAASLASEKHDTSSRWKFSSDKEDDTGASPGKYVFATTTTATTAGTPHASKNTTPNRFHYTSKFIPVIRTASRGGGGGGGARWSPSRTSSVGERKSFVSQPLSHSRSPLSSRRGSRDFYTGAALDTHQTPRAMTAFHWTARATPRHGESHAAPIITVAPVAPVVDDALLPVFNHPPPMETPPQATVPDDRYYNSYRAGDTPFTPPSGKKRGPCKRCGSSPRWNESTNVRSVAAAARPPSPVQESPTKSIFASQYKKKDSPLAVATRPLDRTTQPVKRTKETSMGDNGRRRSSADNSLSLPLPPSVVEQRVQRLLVLESILRSEVEQNYAEETNQLEGYLAYLTSSGGAGCQQVPVGVRSPVQEAVNTLQWQALPADLLGGDREKKKKKKTKKSSLRKRKPQDTPVNASPPPFHLVPEDEEAEEEEGAHAAAEQEEVPEQQAPKETEEYYDSKILKARVSPTLELLPFRERKASISPSDTQAVHTIQRGDVLTKVGTTAVHTLEDFIRWEEHKLRTLVYADSSTSRHAATSVIPNAKEEYITVLRSMRAINTQRVVQRKVLIRVNEGPAGGARWVY